MGDIIVGRRAITACFNAYAGNSEEDGRIEFEKWKKLDDKQIMSEDEFGSFLEANRNDSKESCGNCVFWKYLDTPRFQNPESREMTSRVIWDGECRRNAPKCFPGADIGDGLGARGFNGQWPEVNNYQWCGEYKKGNPEFMQD